MSTSCIDHKMYRVLFVCWSAGRPVEYLGGLASKAHQFLHSYWTPKLTYICFNLELPYTEHYAFLFCCSCDLVLNRNLTKPHAPSPILNQNRCHIPWGPCRGTEPVAVCSSRITQHEYSWLGLIILLRRVSGMWSLSMLCNRRKV